MNLLVYMARTLYREAKNTVYPDGFNCWLQGQTHSWDGTEPEPGWASKQCEQCGHTVHGCGI